MPAAPKPTRAPNAVIPTQKTLEKYGLTSADFMAMLEAQNFICPICGKTPNPSAKDGKIRFVVDHYHAKGWKKMPPEKRRLYVRGLLCWYDNRYFLSKGITREKAQAVNEYLKEFEDKWKNAPADADKPPMIGIIVSSGGVNDSQNSTINATLSMSTTWNTSVEGLIIENGVYSSGKSNAKSTAKRR